ncbi:MAG: hypothetical protein HY695_13100 [Deltaproteobacteria bacterium]|nr:hypothetical protein [Deltaproteobacteria bacterium]
MSRKFLASFAGAALLFSVVGLANAKKAPKLAVASANCQKKIALTATAAGAALDISGTAEVRKRGAQQRFKVSMDAAVEDGATFVVFANNLPVGTITISLGDGELEVNNNNGKVLPAGVNPVCSIGPVVVVDGNTVVLEGSF